MFRNCVVLSRVRATRSLLVRMARALVGLKFFFFLSLVTLFAAACVDVTSCVPTCDVIPVGQRGDQARHLLVGVQEDHQQGRCVRVPGAGAVIVEHFDAVANAQPACGSGAALLTSY